MDSHTATPPRPEAPPPPAATTDAALMQHNLEFMQMAMKGIEALAERVICLEKEVSRLRERLNK